MVNVFDHYHLHQQPHIFMETLQSNVGYHVMSTASRGACWFGARERFPVIVNVFFFMRSLNARREEPQRRPHLHGTLQLVAPPSPTAPVPGRSKRCNSQLCKKSLRSDTWRGTKSQPVWENARLSGKIWALSWESKLIAPPVIRAALGSSAYLTFSRNWHCLKPLGVFLFTTSSHCM